MRSRHRHFNARDCGAALCLDARFVSNKSDNDNIETWSDRSINAAHAVQPTLLNRPLYKSSIQGGQPVVRFDGTDDFYPMTTPLAETFKNKVYGLVLATARDQNPTGGNAQHYIFIHSNSSDARNIRAAFSTRDNGGNRFRSGARRLDADTFSSAQNSASDANWHIFASEMDWFNNINRLRIDYLQSATAAYSSGAGSTSNTNSLNTTIGRGRETVNEFAAPVDLAQLVLINAPASAAIVKRLHHAASYSFKIACS